MGTLTDYSTTELTDHVFKAAYSPPANLYLALCTATIDAQDVANTDITETDYTNYARTEITVSAVAARAVTQDAIVSFPQAGGVSTSDILSWAILDSASGVGNVLAFGSFNGGAWNVVTNNTPKIPSGEVVVSYNAPTNGFTNIAVNKMLDLMFNGTAWTSPNATIHFGLTTATILTGNAMTDITECAAANNYSRKAVPAASMGAASAGVTSNTSIVTFATPSGPWGTVTSMFVVNDASGTAGDLLAYDNTNIVDQEPTTDDTVQFAVGDFDVDLD